MNKLLIKELIFRIKPTLMSTRSYIRANPHMSLAILLFLLGIAFLSTSFSMIAGALFGAGASLLGSWITELNNRRSREEDRKQHESNARRYFAPELHRVIERILYIHSRSISNFTCASVNYLCPPAKKSILPNDTKEDFIPYLPILYPGVPQFKDLPGDDAISLIEFYDSLYALDTYVKSWWNREGQLSVNIFNMIMTHADKSLSLAEICIQKFELERIYLPQYQSWGTLTSRIENSRNNAKKASELHLTRSVTKNNS
ncbi:TPA: hypothetical protein RXU73_000317 [Yersinia enterocolitica]|uniref:hypothetical protein n=1 Tax=Yersinia enterocolitica TaxID=630 RepID=UPI001C60DF29|nr:hypothetical protein [Yersinia enterocolitica]ELX2271383.1 hypothetical protein [Yersinia enterocolitica]MBW5836182.1 hypothetical protein [Yersinia enterocolitica]HEA9920787.1 hypothetical protein [Yersinia enterocolitica]HEK6318912.1 hypothetical protein [Yersinia enterocolitica]